MNEVDYGEFYPFGVVQGWVTYIPTLERLGLLQEGEDSEDILTTLKLDWDNYQEVKAAGIEVESKEALLADYKLALKEGTVDGFFDAFASE